jgi:hypothetical protein
VRRDDRTIRLLGRLLGEQHAELAFTHFLDTTVQLSATAEALQTPNGLLAYATASNMLTRFVGSLQLVVIGVGAGEVGRLRQLLSDLRAVDSRPRKVLSLRQSFPSQQLPVRLHIGQAPKELSDVGRGAVYVAFDGWTFTLQRDEPAGPVVSSETPFGGLLAACFGVAEVFKDVLLSAAPNEAVREKLRKRQVNGFRYSAWLAEPTNLEASEANNVSGPEPAPPVRLEGVLQVGAGAVGNATVLALASTGSVAGELTALDSKFVDEKNLNRCLYFRESDVGTLKVKVVEARASRTGFVVHGLQEVFSSRKGEGIWLFISTVDNNEVRHAMQEVVPEYIVQGATSGTSVAVSVHTGVDRLSCLVCRHPDRHVGLVRQLPLSVEDAASRTGLPEDVIRLGEFHGSAEITPEFLNEVRKVDVQTAQFFEREHLAGHDLCGAIGDFRARYGLVWGPQEPSVPFASAFAGVQAAAEAVKLALRRSGVGPVPVLTNVLVVDFARDYSRHASLSFAEPPRGDCQFCQKREALVKAIYRKKWGTASDLRGTVRTSSPSIGD